jgi:hypothetical protein
MLKNNLRSITKNFVFWAIITVILQSVVAAQTSEFTYQGKLNDTSAPANGQYDFTFKLYDSANVQVGAAVLRNDVQVTNGVFSVTLDFGAGTFDGGARVLEIGVRPGASTGAYTMLAPKQPVTSAPYAVKSLTAAAADTATNATQLGGVNAAQFVQTNDPRLSDARDPLPNSPSYVQNRTTPQAMANFNISGDGTVGGTMSAGVVDSASQYNVGSNRILSAVGNQNLFAGIGAGRSGNGAAANTYVGNFAGSNTTGNENSFFGASAGAGTTTGWENSFFGYVAGQRSTTGSGNSAFGAWAGGYLSNIGNLVGGENSFFGYKSGIDVSTGSGNTLIGAHANLANGGISYSTAIGFGSTVGQNNSVVLGDGSVRVGIGTPTPQNRLQIIDGGNTGLRVQNNAAGGTVASFGQNGDFQIDGGGVAAGRFNLRENGSLILGDCPGCFTSPTDRLIVAGTMRLTNFVAGGSTSVCRNSNGQFAACSSSLRYKSDVAPYRRGLDLIKDLQPISFRWKEDGAADLGLGAESVAKVEPLLVTHNDSGEVEGVKYDRVAVVLVNAVKEQQALIEKQQTLIDGQQRQINALRRIVMRRKRK